MSPILQKIKIWKKNPQNKKNPYLREGVYPLHDWAILMACAIVVTFLMMLSFVYFYVQIERGKLFVQEDASANGKVNINSTLLRKVVGAINTRAASSTEISSIAIPDPSI